MDIEFETKLLVDCDHPEGLIKDLAARKSIGPYDIIKSGSILMQDQYFDTEKLSLSKDGIALRIRKIGPEYLVCIKAKEHIHEWGGIERIEIEKGWSRKALNKIIPCLGEICGKVDENAFCKDNPGETFSRMGMKCIQDRQTNRIILDIAHPQVSSKRHCTEMALDRVFYRFAGRSFIHYEIEIEAKILKCDIHMKTLVALLNSEFPGKLKRWDHNKLITGYAIEMLLEKGELSVDSSGFQALGHDQYLKIEAMIAQFRD